MKVITSIVFISLCSMLGSSQAEETNEILAGAQQTLMNSGIELDTEDDHFDNLKEHDDLPNAYRLVLESMLEEAKNCDLLEKYRRADGVCNNMGNRLWGAALQYQSRLLPNAYLDGMGIPRMLGSNQFYLASSRKVSSKCFQPNMETAEFLDKHTTQMSMQWGQYIDHDLVFTEVMPGSGCCSDPRHTCIHPDTFSDGPCFPIGIADDDRHFNTSCMTFKRSFATYVKGVREQISGVTSFIDASTVYGSNQAHQDRLRTLVDGLLKVEEGDHLPIQGGFKCGKKTKVPTGCPNAGDTRVSVFHGLTIMHLLFVREHNRLARKLKAVQPAWSDDKIFQETRKIVIAFHQKITYEEYLPHIIGPLALSTFQLLPGSYQYESHTNPNIINSFAAAAFRFGHSQINAVLPVNDKTTPISETFFNTMTGPKAEYDIKSILKSQCRKEAQKVDTFFTKEVTDLLFLDVDAVGHSTDLGARNVQRGRDHGVPPYLDFFDLTLQKFGFGNVTIDSFTLPQCLKSRVYDSAHDIDLFVGGLAETHLPGALVGPTFAYINAEQFRRVKFGDRFFYESNDPIVGFTPDQLGEIRKQSLSSVACRNSLIRHIQPDVFAMVGPSNREISCDDYQDIDFSFWKGASKDNTTPETEDRCSC